MTRSWTAEHAHRYRPAYAVPGIVTWTIIAITLVGVVAFPRDWIVVTSLFMAYFISRMILTVIFYFAGRVRVRQWERRDWSSGDQAVGPGGFTPSDVWHVVIVPNYKEPLEILRRTVSALAAQHRATERLVLVLAMEEREEGAAEKGRMLAEEYAGAFADVLVTVHPAGLPDEIPGKAGNQSWAATEAYAHLVEERGVPSERVTVTSCDADSVMHPLYFVALSHLFAHDERRYARFWQAPLFYDNNLWHVPAPVRFTAWLAHAGQLAELTMPLYEPLPISTYTLSLKTAAECGYWDPMVISEDWHSHLNVLFERAGDVSTAPVFLPTRGDATGGPTFFAGLKNRHEQVMRHAWGAEDAGFMLARMVQERRLRLGSLFRFVQVLHDHVMRAAGWFLVVSTYLLIPHAQPLYMSDLTRIVLVHPGVPYLRWVFAAGAASLAVTVAAELLRVPPPAKRRPIVVALELVAAWVTLPFVGFYLGTLPALRAQTRLMLGLPFYFKVTPKAALAEEAG